MKTKRYFMKKYLLTTVWFILIVSCSSTRNASGDNKNSMFDHHETISTSFDDVDTSNIIQHFLSADQKPAPLTDLSRTQDGAYVLAPGYYEADFKTYCLQPG